MTEDVSLSRKWLEYRPSKKLWLASCLAAAAGTAAIGFGTDAWVTRGAAQQMAEQAAQQARAKLTATACVERFANADNFTTRLERFQQASAYDRERLIEKGNWATLPGVEEPVASAPDRCADRVADLEPAQRPASKHPSEATERS